MSLFHCYAHYHYVVIVIVIVVIFGVVTVIVVIVPSLWPSSLWSLRSCCLCCFSLMVVVMVLDGHRSWPQCLRSLAAIVVVH